MRFRLLLIPLCLQVLCAGIPPVPARAAQESVVTIQTTLGDTTETFWLQIPAAYNPAVPCPLLVAWHQLGGDHLELKYATDIDSIADARGWIAVCHRGPTTTHWNNLAAQSHVVDVIHWVEARYSVDPLRLYMIGSSMGGAAAMIFADNHLDPEGPMVAAAASVSGIQDCERRFHEQGINHSMTEAFGGSPEEVPFTYHRNSAICFADSTQSMHRNARHLPLLLSFGHGQTDSIWRSHAEDLYAAMVPFADTVAIRESSLDGHGWAGAETSLLCDFLGSFRLDPHPYRISIDADEEGRWYWADIRMRVPEESFARFEGFADPLSAQVDFTMIRNVRSAALDLEPLGFPLNQRSFTCLWSIEDGEPADLSFEGLAQRPAAVLRDGAPDSTWTWDPLGQGLTLQGEGSALYSILLETGSVRGDPASVPPLEVWSLPGREIRYRLREAGGLRWELFDPGGRLLAAEERVSLAAGEGTIRLGSDIPAGVCFLRIRLLGDPASALVRKHVVLP